MLSLQRRCLKNSSILPLLQRAVETRTSDSDQKLPSWVPDWTSSQESLQYGREPYTFLNGVHHHFRTDSQKSKWKILRVQAVFPSFLCNEDDNGIFETSLPLTLDVVGTVRRGDELWAIHQGRGIHVLRKREGGGYLLIGLAIALPGKVTSTIGDCHIIQVDSDRLNDYDVVMNALKSREVKWIEIF